MTIEFANTKTTRVHEHELFKPRCISNIRRSFFSQRVSNIWNSLQSILLTFKHTLQNVDFVASIRNRRIASFVLCSYYCVHFSFYGQLSVSPAGLSVQPTYCVIDVSSLLVSKQNTYSVCVHTYIHT